MGATYTRQSTYADGDTITAAHTNDEFDQLLAAFQASTGHTHDGTDNEGGPISKLLSNTLTFGAATAGTDITITFDGETNDGELKWMEDEDYFEFSDDILIASTEKLQFRDTAIHISSTTDGQLDLVADGAVVIDTAGDITLDADGGDIFFKDGGTTFGSATNSSGNLIIKSGTTTALTFSGANATVAGNLTVDGNFDVTGTLDFSDSAITNVGSIQLDSISGDEDSNTSITFSGSDVITMATGGTAALTIDASQNVTIAGDLTVSGDDITMATNTSGNLLIADGTNFNSVAVGSLSEITTVANDDVFLAVDTSGGGLKKIQRSAVVAGLATSAAISAIVQDTSPNLGADLDTNSFNIKFDDAHGILDDSGNEQLIFKKTSSAVNQFDITNAATGNAPKLSATGGDSNIDLELEAKGTGHLTVRGNTNSGAIQLNCEANTHGQTIIAASHSALNTSSGNPSTLTLPSSGDASQELVASGATQTLTNKTLTSPVLNTATVGTSIVPASADGATLGSASAEFSDLFLADGGTIQLGNDQDVRIIHDADDGLILKSTATGDDNPFLLTLQTGETDIASGDVLGQIDFQAPDEGTGTDAILVAAGIAAVSEGDFSASSNATKLSFRTASSETASEKMSLSSAGLLTVADDIVFKDGGTIGVTSAVDAMTVSSAGIVTFKDDILIKDGGTIGSASDADAITIASNGQLTLTQQLNGTAGDFSGDVGAATFQPDGDTSAGDSAAIGFTSAEGLILTGQGSSTDVTIKNDADATVASIATGTTIFTLNDDVDVDGRATGTQTTDNDGNFDLSVSNFFKCTPSGNFDLTLSNPAEGQSGTIMLINSGGHTVSAHASIAINASTLTAISNAGTYMLTYYCSASSGNNTILVGATGALT